MTAAGAQVLTNDPVRKILTGLYWQRNRAAFSWGASLYLACHLNAGRGSYAAVEMIAARRDPRLFEWIGNELVHSVPEILSSHGVALSPGDRGVVCIGSCSQPAAIIEPFFGDNPRQQGLFASFRLIEVGQAIARGVIGWWQGRPAA
jgi:hypothetical protein